MANLNKGKDNLKNNKIVKKIFDTSDSNDKHFVSSTEETFISESYASAKHLTNVEHFNNFAPLMYQLKLIQDEIEELREFVSTELATTGSVVPISASFANVSQSIFSGDKNALASRVDMNETKLSSFNIGDSAQGLLFTTGSKGKSTLLTIQVGKSIFQLTSIT